ncbi:hypothetical protein GGX14DRAFT_646027 [Mycena pura]|uniref:Uncharacterized protein n=1 Tax=Mycena pura TaxID=153505 RepID=A0AAD6V7Y5_9AGAR|nr:hypothetical protein GGX14DRAFT_646027 [Mycena pura]
MSAAFYALSRARWLHPINSPGFHKKAIEYLGLATQLDPAAARLWDIVHPRLKSGHVNYRNTSRYRLPRPFDFHAEGLMTDAYQAIFETAYEIEPEIFEEVFLNRAGECPHGDFRQNWSPLSRYALRLVGTAMLMHSVRVHYEVAAPRTIQITIGSQYWALGTSIAGRDEGKREVQQYLQKKLLQEFPVLHGWEAPLASGTFAQLPGQCAETRPWIQYAIFHDFRCPFPLKLTLQRLGDQLRDGGTVLSLAASIPHTRKRLQAAHIAWDKLLACKTEDEFWRAYTSHCCGLFTRHPMCGNCASMAQVFDVKFGATIIDLAKEITMDNIEAMKALLRSLTPDYP